MINLYTLINSQIENICSCFVDHYPEDEDKVYPYVEIKFPNILPHNSYWENVLMEIEVWDNKGTDIREIEGLVDLIDSKLKNLRYNDSFFNVSIQRNTPYRLSLPDPEIHIQRRQLRYIATVYSK